MEVVISNEIGLIKDRVPILEFISKRISVKPIGTRKYRSNPCPFCGHNDCFTIYSESSSYKCFSCGEGGDIFSYLMKAENVSFIEAAEILAKESGITLSKGFSQESKKQNDIINSRQQIFELAASYYHEVFKKTPEAIKYIKERRKRDDRTISKTKYGYADGNLHQFLKKKKISEGDIIASGLVRAKGDKLYDLFSKGVFVYPVFNSKKVVDFFCKDYLNEGDRREYQLPASHKISNPSFYGKDSLYHKEVILVEGAEDRLSVLQHINFPTCAILGQLSSQQLSFIAAHCENSKIYLAFDNDTAGRKYEEEIIDSLAGQSVIQKLVWSDEYKDIDEFVKSCKDPVSSLKETIDKSQDAIAYKISVLPNITGMSPHIAEGYWRKICQWIAKFDQDVTRMFYVEQLADKIGGKTRFLQPIKNTVSALLSPDRSSYPAMDDGLGVVNKETGILEQGNKYYRADPEKGIKKISEFTLKIQAYIEMDGEIYYKTVLTNSKGIKSNPLIFNSMERVNKKQFREKCGSAGSFYFMGTDNDLVEIWQREEDLARIETRTCYFQRYGYIDEHKVWLFSNCAVQNGVVFDPDNDGIIKIGDIGYLSKDVRIYSGDAPKINIKEKVTLEYIENIIQHFHIMMDDSLHGFKGYRGYLLIGFVSAMVYLNEIIKIDRKFPYLLIYGASGTGKSEVIQLLMHFFGFSHGGENWGEATPTGISMAVEQLSSLPYWLEEFKNVLGTSPRQQKKVELLNNIYNRSSTGKGGLENRTTREVNGSIIFTGQDRPEDKAFLSRSVVVDKEVPTMKATESYFYLRAERHKFSAIFLWLLKYKTDETVSDLKKLIKTYQEVIRKMVAEKGETGRIDERSIYNYCILAASFTIGFGHIDSDDFITWLAEEIIEDVRRKSCEDVLFRFFEDVEVIFDDIGFVSKKTGGLIYLSFNKIYMEWKKLAARVGTAEYISKNGLIDYMKKDSLGYWKGYTKAYIYGKQHRCITLEIEKLPTNIKAIVEDWQETL